MPELSDAFDLARLGLSSGEGRRLDLHVELPAFTLGGERYDPVPRVVAVNLDVSGTTGNGYALRLRYSASLDGTCMRCLGPAAPTFDLDVREIHQPGEGEELASPYVDELGELDLAGWARDALALALPATITCTPECRGLCAQCGADLNDDPSHGHEREPDHRWAKLSELRFD